MPKLNKTTNKYKQKIQRSWTIVGRIKRMFKLKNECHMQKRMINWNLIRTTRHTHQACLLARLVFVNDLNYWKSRFIVIYNVGPVRSVFLLRSTGQIIWGGKGNKTYIEGLGKQQQTFTWFHGAALAIAQQKHNTLQDENKLKVIEFRSWSSLFTSVMPGTTVLKYLWTLKALK